MTKREFYEEYQRLSVEFSSYYSMADTMKLRLLFNMVENLERSWMRSVVNRIIKSGKPEFDFARAAAGEIRARKSAIETVRMVENETVAGNLERHLRDLGVQSLVEVLEIKDKRP